MYLRSHKRKKDGKEHRYFSIVEARRLSSGKSVQKRCLYLGEINDSQQDRIRTTVPVRLTPAFHTPFPCADV
jgi:hypothetical protein